MYTDIIFCPWREDEICVIWWIIHIIHWTTQRFNMSVMEIYKSRHFFSDFCNEYKEHTVLLHWSLHHNMYLTKVEAYAHFYSSF